MKLLLKLTAFAVSVVMLLSLVSCADLGVGESADDFKKYFSGVYVVSKNGASKYAIGEFNRDISIEDTDIPTVIPHNEYCYIGFRVAEGYTVSLSEFAFHALSGAGEGVLELEFYIVDKMPKSIKNDSGEDTELPPLDEEEEVSPEEGDGSGENDADGDQAEGEAPEGEQPDGEGGTGEDTEDSEEDIFVPESQFHVSTFKVGEEWDSVLLQFDGAKTVESGQYVVVRINNNCYSPSGDGEEEQTPSVSFTFNYLLFHFTDAYKK